MCQLQMLLSITFVPLRSVLQFEFLSVSSRRKWISIYSPLQIATISFLRVLTKIIRNFYVSWTNKNEREELNNADKQIDTFQPSGASFDKQSVICLPTVGSHQTLERIFERRALSFAWLENNRAIVGRNITMTKVNSLECGCGLRRWRYLRCNFPSFLARGGRERVESVEWIDACFASHGDIDLFLSRLCQLWE